jgi:hypothetical protein
MDMLQNTESVKMEYVTKNTGSGVCEHTLKIRNISGQPARIFSMMPFEMKLDEEHH